MFYLHKQHETIWVKVWVVTAPGLLYSHWTVPLLPPGGVMIYNGEYLLYKNYDLGAGGGILRGSGQDTISYVK